VGVDEDLTNRKFRVLALDGGGIRGAYTAAVLAELERASGCRVAECFDLVTGTSTGGLIALGLALGHSAEEVLAFYNTHGPHIFPCSLVGNMGRRLRQAVWSTKYRSAALKSAIQDLLGVDTLLGKASIRVVLTAFDVTNGKVACFKTNHHPKLRIDHERRAWEFAMATAAAPTYFPAYRASWGTLYVDGGVWANAPVMVGVIEAAKYFDQPVDRIDVLSIGTTSTPFHLSDRRRFPWILPPTASRGFLTSGPKLIELLMQASASAVLEQARIMTRVKGEMAAPTVARIDHVDVRGRFPMDDPRILTDLISLGRRAGQSEADALLDRFLTVREEFAGRIIRTVH